jgi:hypothetical protein
VKADENRRVYGLTEIVDQIFRVFEAWLNQQETFGELTNMGLLIIYYPNLQIISNFTALNSLTFHNISH